LASCSCRLIIVSNVLPIRAKREPDGWQFEWDEDALVAQAKVRHAHGSSSSGGGGGSSSSAGGGGSGSSVGGGSGSSRAEGMTAP
jgi:uncharacterized membrane protein YgcG